MTVVAPYGHARFIENACISGGEKWRTFTIAKDVTLSAFGWMHWLGKPQLRQRSDRISPAYVWNDTQLEHSDRRKINV